MRTLSGILAAAVSLTSASLSASALQSSTPSVWEWRGAIEQGKAVEIRGVTGDIRAIPSQGAELEVSALIDGGSRPEGVEIRTVESIGGITFCAVRQGATSCDSEALNMTAARVDYELRMPAGVHLNARTVNGEIQARSLSGNVDAVTVNGGVVVSTTGTVQARTVNGSIDASLLKPFWARDPEFSAVNGKIKVTIPTKISLGVHAETRNGRIVADVPDFHGVSTDQRLDGHVGGGGGGNQLVIRTINGAIELRRRF